MDKVIRKSAFFLTLCLFLGAAAFAQTSAIEGDVKDENGKGVKDALVKITRTDIKGNYKVKTDKKGHYFHAGLPLGNVQRCGRDRRPGSRHCQQCIRTRLGDPTNVSFDLKAKAAQAAALQAGRRTGHPDQRADSRDVS